MLGFLLLLPAADAVRGDPWLALDNERVRAELERTDQVIERAIDVLLDCGSVQGKTLLRQSREMQRKAWSLYRPLAPDLPSSQILLLTRRARELAVDAIEHCQVELKAHTALQAMLESTTELLRKTLEEVYGTSAAGAADARRLLEAGDWQLEKARDAYRAGQYRRAITLGTAARNLILRAQQRARASDGAPSESRIELAIDRTELVLAEVRERVGPDSEARGVELLNRAEVEQGRARDLLREGRRAQALHRTRAARVAALDALWILEPTPSPERVVGAIDMVEAMIAENDGEIEGSASEEARQFLAEAKAQLDEAREALRRDDGERAVQAVRAADALLRRAMEKAGR